ncbi:hypothetical protein ACOA15_005961, partial [Klebsiella oxytoca]
MAEVPLPTPTDNQVPSTDIRDAVYAGAMLDKVVTSTELKYTDRLGGQHYTVDGIKAEGDKVVEETRQNLIPLSRQYMTLADAQADIANIPEGSTTYVRSPDGSTLADEYINNAGTLVPTGRAMLSEEGVGKIAQKAVDDIQKAQSTEGIAYSMTFSGGERSFLEFGYDGAPSEHSARLIMSPDNVNEEFQQAVLGRKEQNTQDVAYSMTFSGGERSFLEFGYDGAPSAASSKLIAGKLNLSETSQQFREDIQTLAGGGGSGSSRNLIAVQTAPQDSNFREYPKVRKISDAPIFTQADQSAASIYWPWFYDNSQHGGNGITLFYSTDHATVHANSGVFAATADTPEGPYTFHGLVFRDDAGGTQCETPCVMYDEKNQRFLMYYQMESVGVGSQSTCVAVSDALLSGYSRDSVCVDMMSLTQPGDGHCGYFRPFRYNGGWFGYSLYGGAYHSRNGFWRSRDGINWMLDPRLSCQRQDVMTGWDDYGQLYTCLL